MTSTSLSALVGLLDPFEVELVGVEAEVAGRKWKSTEGPIMTENHPILSAKESKVIEVLYFSAKTPPFRQKYMS